MSNKKNKYIRLVNATKRSTIAENLENNIDCESNFNLKIFKVIKNCFHISDLIKLEAICILLKKTLNCVNLKILIKIFRCFYNFFIICYYVF